MTKYVSKAFVLVMLGLVVGSFGCDDALSESKEKGDLLVSWEISPQDDCEKVSVETVEVMLKGGDEPVSAEKPCSESEVLFERVPVGTYKIELRGKTEKGRTIFSGKLTEVKVKANEKVETDANLTALPAKLVVEWRFANGKLCGSNKVEEIEIAVFDSDSNEEGRKTFKCNDGSGRFEDLEAGQHTVIGSAESEGGTAYEDRTEVELVRGEESTTEVELAQEQGE